MLTDGKLKWNRINEQYDVAYNASTGERLEFTGDPKLNRKTILTHFPNVSPQALDRYYSRCFWARLWGMLIVGLKILPPFFTRILFPLVEPFFKRNALSTTLDVLKDCGLPEDVIGAITYSWGDYGTPPGASPFFIQAFMESHYNGGAFYPVGGSASIAKTLVASITRRGGYVFCGAPVESILTQETRRGIHRAVGVRVHGVDITAKRCVISGAGFQRTFGPKAEYELHDPLVSRIASKKQLSLIQDEQGNVALKSSPAFFSLFVALGALDEDLGLTGQNVWYLRDWSHDDNMAKLLSQKTVKEALQEDPPLVFVSNESAKDPDYNKRHPGKSSVNIICIAKSEWFQSLSETDHDHRGQEYEKIKSELTNVLLNILYKLFPKTRGHVIFSELGTPLSANKYLGREHGQIYNLDHTVARFGSVGALLALHPETTVKNLYLTGQDVFVVSVVGATFAGLCAAARTSALSLFFYAVPVLAAAVQMAMG
jgi:all-trans-retinol 13,14-reductase